MRILFVPNWRVFRTRSDRQPADYQEAGSSYWFFRHFRVSPLVKVLGAATWPGWKLEEKLLHFYFVQGLIAVIAARSFDVVLAHGAQSAIVLLAVKRLLPGLLPPIVVVDVGTLNGGRPDRWDFALTRWAFAASDAIIWHARVSQSTISRYAPELIDRGLFVPFGVEGRDYPEAVSCDGDYAVCVGYARRDWCTLFESWELLGDIPLLLVGVHSRFADGLPAGVEAIPSVSFTEYTRLVRESRMVVLPVEDGCASWGQMTLLQALALGKPVVVTDSAPVRDYVDTGVVSVPPGDAQSLADAVLSVWNDPAMRERLSREAQAVVRARYNERDMARRFEVVLTEVVARRRSR